MMKILVLNSGSSSIKFKLYEVNTENDQFHALCEGQADRIGIAGSTVSYARGDEESVEVNHPTRYSKMASRLASSASSSATETR